MFNSRIATAARNAVVGAVVGMAPVSLASACGPATPTMTSPTTTSGIYGNPPTTQSPTPTSGMYGAPAAAAKSWQQQSLEDNCGLLSVADVVGQITGHEPTEQQIIALAEKTPSQTNPGPIYAPPADPIPSNGSGGIEMADAVVLLAYYGIKSVMTDTTHPDQTGL